MMRKTILEVPGVVGVHELRTRRMGSQLLADMHIHVDPLISVSEGHSIGDRVMLVLEQKFSRLSDIVVHIDPEDDLAAPGQIDLPLRPDIERAVHKALTRGGIEPEAAGEPDPNLVLHYVGDNIIGELTFSLPAPEQRGDLDEQSRALSDRLIQETPLSAVKILFRG